MNEKRSSVYDKLQELEMSERNHDGSEFKYYIKKPLDKTDLEERKDRLKVYAKHRYYGALIVCGLMICIGMGAISFGEEAMLLFQIGSFLIIVALTWFVLSLLRYVKILLLKSGKRNFITEYRQVNALYLGENDDYLFIVNPKYGVYPSTEIIAPSVQKSNSVSEKKIRLSPFYRFMKREFRLLANYGNQMELNAFCSAVNQIMEEQAMKGNAAFFKDQVPFKSYK